MNTRYKVPPVPRYSCQSCGASTTLPFVPRPGKPITCTNCWRKDHEPTGRRSSISDTLMTKPADRMFKAGLSWKWKPKQSQT